ncbi:hypothetical protein [Glaesserella sp.]|uniref:hypothetical protein n=1 Tax=Glaesserella sp. TaxID=2094731 RepID=UPI0035A04E9B
MKKLTLTALLVLATIPAYATDNKMGMEKADQMQPCMEMKGDKCMKPAEMKMETMKEKTSEQTGMKSEQMMEMKSDDAKKMMSDEMMKKPEMKK